MSLRLHKLLALILALGILATAGVDAQGPPPPGAIPAPPTQPAPLLPQDQLDALLAPIALYPDQLLSQVLMASTYPLEVVEAARFVQQNPGLRGEALDQALQGKNWDPSVQSLAAFPQVLAMMNDKLEWTQQLGDAFLANQQQVMQTVQSLRARAQAAGNLQNTEQQRVIVQDRAIVIEPAQPQVVYVPVYNPLVIYGPWWAPAYRPWFWYPPPIYGYPPLASAFGVGIVWGAAWAVSFNHWGWCHPNWHGGSINVNVTNNYFFNRPQYRDRYAGGTWQHLPEHRRGVAYRDVSVQNRYVRTNSAGVQTREAYRGRDVSQAMPTPTPGAQRPGSFDRSATAGAQRPGATMERPSPGGATNAMVRPTPTTTPSVSAPANMQSRPSPMPSSVQSRPSPAFNANQSQPQAQQYSHRGAQSRAAMNAPPSGAGVVSHGGAQGANHGRDGEGGGARSEGGARGEGSGRK